MGLEKLMSTGDPFLKSEDLCRFLKSLKHLIIRTPHSVSVGSTLSHQSGSFLPSNFGALVKAYETEGQLSTLGKLRKTADLKGCNIPILFFFKRGC